MQTVAQPQFETGITPDPEPARRYTRAARVQPHGANVDGGGWMGTSGMVFVGVRLLYVFADGLDRARPLGQHGLF